eukprot:tig00021432_g21204.t1
MGSEGAPAPSAAGEAKATSLRDELLDELLKEDPEDFELLGLIDRAANSVHPVILELIGFPVLRDKQPAELKAHLWRASRILAATREDRRILSLLDAETVGVLLSKDGVYLATFPCMIQCIAFGSLSPTLLKDAFNVCSKAGIWGSISSRFQQFGKGEGRKRKPAEEGLQVAVDGLAPPPPPPHPRRRRGRPLLGTLAHLARGPLGSPHLPAPAAAPAPAPPRPAPPRPRAPSAKRPRAGPKGGPFIPWSFPYSYEQFKFSPMARRALGIMDAGGKFPHERVVPLLELLQLTKAPETAAALPSLGSYVALEETMHQQWTALRRVCAQSIAPAADLLREAMRLLALDWGDAGRRPLVADAFLYLHTEFQRAASDVAIAEAAAHLKRASKAATPRGGGASAALPAYTRTELPPAPPLPPRLPPAPPLASPPTSSSRAAPPEPQPHGAPAGPASRPGPAPGGGARQAAPANGTADSSSEETSSDESEESSDSEA